MCSTARDKLKQTQTNLRQFEQADGIYGAAYPAAIPYTSRCCRNTNIDGIIGPPFVLSLSFQEHTVEYGQTIRNGYTSVLGTEPDTSKMSE